MSYKVKAKFKEVWMESDETFEEHGVAMGITVGLEIKGADETDIVEV